MALPTSHRLQDVAKWFVNRVGGDEKQEQLVNNILTLCAQERKPLRFGSICSGTDSIVAVLASLQKVLGDMVQIRHVFSCEFDAKKRQWIRDNFPDLQLLFGDVNDLRNGEAMNYITNEMAEVPAVDIVVAGFVCKSVSTENNNRQDFSNCINEESGKTGETFGGMMAYIAKYKPSMVVCENVRGISMWNNGAEPVIIHVEQKFVQAGYSFNHQILDARQYLLPQRRNRCWMWAFLNDQDGQAAANTAML